MGGLLIHGRPDALTVLIGTQFADLPNPHAPGTASLDRRASPQRAAPARPARDHRPDPAGLHPPVLAELATRYHSAYHERWEIELSFDEIETHQTGNHRVLRSKTPELVKQEIWSLLLTHYAIRHVMKDAADTVGTDPDNLSFMRSYRAIRRQVTKQAGFSP